MRPGLRRTRYRSHTTDIALEAGRMIDTSLVACALGVLTALAVSAGGPAKPRSIAAPGATVVKIASDFEFTEGPACDAKGNVYFTDQPNDRILKWTPDGKITTFLQPAGRSNGLCFDSTGDLWACADEKNEMWRIHPDGEHEVIFKDHAGKLLNGPNDVWLRPDGGLYFSDPYYERSYWHRGPKEYGGEYVFYLTPDHKTLRPVATRSEEH